MVIVLLLIIFLITFFLLGYFASSKPVSYLPEIKSENFRTKLKNQVKIELKGSGYILTVSDTGDINVSTNSGDLILSGLKYYTSFEGTKQKLGLDNISVKLISDNTISITGVDSLGNQVNILFTVPGDKPKLDINVRTKFKTDTKIYRETMIARFDMPVTEVYQKNRQVMYDDFDTEYWLQRQGVRFGRGDRSALIFNCNAVSSLQLDTRKNLLFVNLDYYLDHPFIHYPFQEDAGGKWEDLSRSLYRKGSEKNNAFTIYFNIPGRIPRLMLVPKGYLAGYVFTEHADGGTLRTNRAAYFGAEDITDISNSVGGFAGYRIPVTKSVFYADPAHDYSSHVSVRDDSDFPQFRDFLDQLNETGLYDIGLHTPENLNSTRDRLKESIKYMYERYDTSTWIDHGFTSGKINRECFVSDGLNPASDFYAADLWEKYNTRYFWNPALEDIRAFSLREKIKQLKFYEAAGNLWTRYFSPKEIKEISLPKATKQLVKRFREKGFRNSFQPDKGNSFPTPLIWQNPTVSANFYSWGTDNYRGFRNLSSKFPGMEQELIERLISNWGIYFNHGYFVRNGSGDGELIEKNGKLIINPYFDQVLAIMSEMRDRGDLYIMTVRDILDYWVLLNKVSFDYLPDGSINVLNNNDKPIKGLSLAISNSSVRVNGNVPEMRKAGDDTVFWFDIKANGHAVIEVPDK